MTGVPPWLVSQRLLIALAAERGCTQESIAAHVGVGRETVSSWTRATDPRQMRHAHLLALADHAGPPSILAPLGDHAQEREPDTSPPSPAMVFELLGQLVRVCEEAARNGGHTPETEAKARELAALHAQHLRALRGW